jgi:hypothetical protein
MILARFKPGIKVGIGEGGKEKDGRTAVRPYEKIEVVGKIDTQGGKLYWDVEVALPLTKRMTSRAKGKLGLDAVTASEN